MQKINVMPFIYIAVPGAPQNLLVSDITSSSISLSWSPPPFSERLGLALYKYSINCIHQNHAVVMQTEILNVTVANLHPFAPYNCCVAVNSTHGLGQLACQNSFTGEKSESYYIYNTD